MSLAGFILDGTLGMLLFYEHAVKRLALEESGCYFRCKLVLREIPEGTKTSYLHQIQYNFNSIVQLRVLTDSAASGMLRRSPALALRACLLTDL